MSDINTIEFCENDRLKYLKPFSLEDFKNHSMFETLVEEFEKIVEFKNEMLNCEINKIEEMIGSFN